MFIDKDEDESEKNSEGRDVTDDNVEEEGRGSWRKELFYKLYCAWAANGVPREGGSENRALVMDILGNATRGYTYGVSYLFLRILDNTNADSETKLQWVFTMIEDNAKEYYFD
eukprot:TRINITY_DN16876_c0_g1_i1.p1 TRINITY_DN16876_c0_g1~~TRINITY_DN16876_c0_g1_i1.p1  ORF type:complete len:113 (-),score=17.61 TRINITY_DN16876_c0_g1_i1:441-779(-)